MRDDQPAIELCQAEQAIEAPAEAVEVTYATEADRLNVASGGTAFPAASRCLLRVEAPHPAGKPGQAQVTLVVEPQPDPVGWWAKRLGKKPPAPAPHSVRRMDIPAGEVQNLLATLDEQRFYVRSKPLTTEAFVGVERGGERFAKKFYSLPQLDALALRVNQQGVGERGPSTSFARAEAPASYPSTTAPTASAEIASRCRRLPAVSAGVVR